MVDELKKYPLECQATSMPCQTKTEQHSAHTLVPRVRYESRQGTLVPVIVSYKCITCGITVEK